MGEAVNEETASTGDAPVIGSTEEPGLTLVAHPLRRDPMPLVPAPIRRGWMDATPQGFANRCLPLLIANQTGWLLLNTHGFKASWNGGRDRSCLTILYDREAPKPPYPATSMFGDGILTFSIPYLFRTAPGYNLLARGPANWPKDGIAPLEGVIETDWSVATFTMNWQLTRADHVVSFARGEPVCMIVPQRRGELEAFEPSIQSLGQDPDLERGYRAWALSRKQFQARLGMTRLRPARPGRRGPWEKHYFHGTSPGGESGTEHQRKLALRRFRRQAGG